MNRRQFVATFGSAAAWPLGVHGQQSEMPLVAVLMATAADDTDSQDRYQAFLKSLDKAGWAQGKNIRRESLDRIRIVREFTRPNYSARGRTSFWRIRRWPCSR
jgi:hypothetical protein